METNTNVDKTENNGSYALFDEARVLDLESFGLGIVWIGIVLCLLLDGSGTCF